MRDGIRKMRELGYNCVWSGPYSLERIRFGNIDAGLADEVYGHAEIPYAVHVPLIKPSVEATGVPAMLSDQEFGNMYPLALQGKTGSPGTVPDHVDRRVLYDLPAGRIARYPDLTGGSFCAVLYDQPHWRRAYDRG